MYSTVFPQIRRMHAVKIEYVIAGLGNPGLEYENTRHNAGFIVLDMLAKQCGEEINRMQFKGRTADVMLGDKRCLLLKPTTYMNNSGESIVQALEFYKLDVSSLIVVCDDISLDVGRLRIRRKGSHGGHNGLRSICELTGSDSYERIKMELAKSLIRTMTLPSGFSESSAKRIWKSSTSPQKMPASA